MRRTLLSLLLLASLLACERREEPIETQPEIQEPPRLAAKPLTVDEAVATASHYAAIFLGEGIKPTGVTPILSRRTRGDNGERDTMLLAVHMAGGGLTFVDPRLAPQDAVLCVLPDTDAVDSLPPPAQFLIEAISAKLPGWSIDPDGDGPIDWHPEPPPSTGGGGGGGSSGPTDGAHFPPNGEVMPIDGYSPPENDYTVSTSTTSEFGPWLKTKWHQDDPYKKYCIVDGEECVVGCVPVAIGQVLSAHRLPSDLPWDGILSSTTPTGIYMDHVASLLFQIGKKACANFGKEKTGVSVFKIVPTLEEFRLRCSGRSEYNDEVERDLRSGRPVIMVGSKEDCGFLGYSSGGHAWVVDGIRSIKTTTNRYNGKGYLLDTETRTTKYLHANMGWGGLGDGWYALFSSGTSIYTYKYYLRYYAGIRPL